MTTLAMKNASAPRRDLKLAALKTVVFLLALVPLARASWIVYVGDAVNPVEFITRSTGTWALSFLLITLCATPLRRLSGWGWPLRLRRMLGLYAFFYGSLHLATYLWLDQMFDWGGIVHDIAKRPFVTVGFAAMLLMTPLAITSTQGWMRRLKRHWGQLHKLVYLVALLGVLHYWWLVKRDLTQPAMFALALALLLGMRLMHWRQNRRTPT
ncbi:protein-methionine-sulfoxide reductase heme-binding subunit MsrQ [uncultured Aquitalea sp.]|uniref:sulfite oxidase heme-binding subunit YedZ n=1 Tax=uncultured Aquitalea sp. TaxID=540272 RepID=UPI0025F12368|nr:protein-methionine-sulfoxide reductase heme-binding subunit MsrQ [uncultured Aquitalea sp.]